MCFRQKNWWRKRGRNDCQLLCKNGECSLDGCTETKCRKSVDVFLHRTNPPGGHHSACACVINTEKRRMVNSSLRTSNDEGFLLKANIVLCCGKCACVGWELEEMREVVNCIRMVAVSWYEIKQKRKSDVRFQKALRSQWLRTKSSVDFFWESGAIFKGHGEWQMREGGEKRSKKRRERQIVRIIEKWTVQWREREGGVNIAACYENNRWTITTMIQWRWMRIC